MGEGSAHRRGGVGQGTGEEGETGEGFVVGAEVRIKALISFREL